MDALSPGVEQLRRELAARGWTGQDLVDQVQKWAYDHGEGTLGLTRSYVSEWLSGKRGVSRPYARRLGGLLGIPADGFLDRRVAGAGEFFAPGPEWSFISPAGRAALDRLQTMDIVELAGVMATWSQGLNPTVSRRELLLKLSAALALAASAPLLDTPAADTQDQVTKIPPGGVDEATIVHIERSLQDYRRQGDLLGPPLALQTAMAQRQLVRRILKEAHEQLRLRATSVYAELTQLIGWLLFNLGDYRAAAYYYDEARTAAHDAGNVGLVTYVLCTMSQLSSWQGRPRVGIDHAVAAQAWAQHSGDHRASAYAADVAARAYAADQRVDQCQGALDLEQTELEKARHQSPLDTRWYFHDESFFWGTRSECALRLGASEEAWEAATKSLALVDPTNVHNYALTLALQGEARLRQGEIAEASRIIGDVARLNAVSRSQRVGQQIAHLRGELTRWEGTQPVRELDELLNHYASSRKGKGITQRS